MVNTLLAAELAALQDVCVHCGQPGGLVWDLPGNRQQWAHMNCAAQAKADQSNKIRPEDKPVHGWYNFVLSYPPHLVREMIDYMQVDADHLICDPFGGTGTTLVEGQKEGYRVLGVDSLPVQNLAQRVKTNWGLSVSDILTARDQVLPAANKVAGPLVGILPTSDLMSLPEDQAKLIIKNSINPRPLHQCLALRDAIALQDSSDVSDFLRLALATVAVRDASNLRFAPTISVSRAKKAPVDVLAAWGAQVELMAAEMAEIAYMQSAEARCILGDSRDLPGLIAPESIGAVICSPPYPNEADYTRSTRLESVLLGLMGTKADMQLQKRRCVRSNSRGVYVGDTDDQVLTPNSEPLRLADEIDAERARAGDESGFSRQYSKVVRLYFGGMKRHLMNLKPCLAPGARLAYVVGDQASFYQVHIKTGPILADIAREVGYQVLEVKKFRDRTSSRGTLLSEDIVYLEWPGC